MTCATISPGSTALANLDDPSLLRAESLVAVNTPDFAGLPLPLPFGGWKQSGIGREGSSVGIYEYLENKKRQLWWFNDSRNGGGMNPQAQRRNI